MLSLYFPHFPLGRLVATPAALRVIPANEWENAIRRHLNCDWGDVCAADKMSNDRALHDGTRLFSEYHTSGHGGRKFWIITEADRSATIILLPEEY